MRASPPPLDVLPLLMNTRTFRIAASLTTLLAATSVHAAEYRCDAPRSAIDRRACEAAKQGPDALRQFVQRMRPIESLDMNEYVNEATVLAWEQRAAAARLAANQR